MSVNNPHDKFIKDVLSESSHAVASLQAIVPVEIAGLLDWQTLQTEPDSFVDEELQELFADETQEKTLVYTSSGYEIRVGWSPSAGSLNSSRNVMNSSGTDAADRIGPATGGLTHEAAVYWSSVICLRTGD